jgi:ubiquinone/menaquinone biosynthesis C-methylase UbiE
VPLKPRWAAKSALPAGYPATQSGRAMPSLPVLHTLLRELTTQERAPRVPEPDLVMDDPSKVAAYVEAGRPGGVMAPVYLFHCAQACEVIRPGDLVLDLGCGPANQLTMIAALNPEVRFVGVDLSEAMLAQARANFARHGLANVVLIRQDISRLPGIADCSVDAVISTMALHHLPGFAQLETTFAAIARVLRPGGGVYLVDFGHLRSERSIRYFAYQYADRQPELFTLDYFNSLRAAFSKAEFRAAGRSIEKRARLHSTFLSPFMVAFKSRRRNGEPAVRARIRELRNSLPRYHQTDLNDLITFFALGGLRSRLLS